MSQNNSFSGYNMSSFYFISPQGSLFLNDPSLRDRSSFISSNQDQTLFKANYPIPDQRNIRSSFSKIDQHQNRQIPLKDVDLFHDSNIQKISFQNFDKCSEHLSIIQSNCESIKPRNNDKNANKHLFTKNQATTHKIIPGFQEMIAQKIQKKVKIVQKQTVIDDREKSVQDKSQTKQKKSKNVNRNKNIVRDICTKCALYLDLSPRSQQIIQEWTKEDPQKKKTIKRQIQDLRLIKNFQGYKKYYGRKDEVIGVIRQLTMKFYDQEAFVYIWNSSITYKAETISQIGHFKYGLKNLDKFNQYRRWPN